MPSMHCHPSQDLLNFDQAYETGCEVTIPYYCGYTVGYILFAKLYFAVLAFVPSDQSLISTFEAFKLWHNLLHL